MATAYSDEVSVGSYNRIRIKCDYSGTSASVTIQFRRTSSYTTTWASTSSNLTFNGVTKPAAYSYSGTVGTDWVDLVTVTGFSISISGGTYQWNFTQGNGRLYGSGAITIQAQSAANGLSATFISHTWDSVTAMAEVDSWNGTGSSLQFVLNSDPDDFNHSRRAYAVATTGTSGQKTATNNNYVWQYDNNFVLKGCVDYYLSAWCANTGGQDSSYFDTTARHLPPAPLQTLSVSQSASATSATVSATLTIVGGSSANNRTTTVLTQYRWKKTADSDSSYTSWTDISWKNPWETQTATIQIPYSTDITVQARQRYYQEYSEIKTTTFTSTSAVAPSGGQVTVDSTTWETCTLSGSFTSYGTPGQVDGREIILGIRPSDSESRRRKITTTNVLSNTATITNSSPAVGGGFTIRGCQELIPYVYANNRVIGTTVNGDVFYTDPASPTLLAENVGSKIRLTSSGNDNNESVTATFRYCIYEHGVPYQEGGVGAYIGWTELGVYNAQTGTVTEDVAVQTGQAYDIYADILYQNKYSENAVVENVLVTEAPTFTQFDYEDSNPEAVAVTGDNQVFIQNVSLPKVIITQGNKAIAGQGATMVKYLAELNPSVEIPYSDDSDVHGIMTAPTQSGTRTLSVTALDNNNGQTTVSKSVTILPYAGPTLTLGEVFRPDKTGDIQLDVSGTYSPMTLSGVDKNDITVEYRVVRSDGGESTEWGTLTVTKDNGAFTGQIALWISPTSAWEIQVRVTDSLGTVVTALAEVSELSVGAMATPQYDVELWDWHTSTFKMDITKVLVDGIHIKWKVNDIESINFTVDLVQFEQLCRANNKQPTEVLQPYVMDVRVRRNGEYIVGGQIVETNIDISENRPATVEVRCSGFLNLFKDQYISMPVGGYKYSELARLLVEQSQKGDSLIKNPTGDIDASYWISDNPVTISRNTTYHHSGAGSIQGYRASAGWTTMGTQMKVAAGTPILINMWVQGQAGVTFQIVERQYINSSSGQTEMGRVTTTHDNTWYQIQVGYTTHFTNGYIYLQQLRTSAGNIRADDVRIYRADDSDVLHNLYVPLGVNTASPYQTSGRAIDYQLQNVKDALQELTTLGGSDDENFDIEFEPDRTFNCRHWLGTTRSNLLVEYPGNISQLKITRSAANLANKVTNIGSGIGDERLEIMVTDTTSRQIYGTHESTFTSNGTSQTDVLESQAQSELNARKNPTNLPEITISDGSVNPSNLKIGDKFYLKIYEDTYIGSTSGLYRVLEYSLDVDQDSNEKVQLTVESTS